MTNTIRPETITILNKLRDFQLAELAVNPTELSAHLTFRFSPDVQDIIVELFNIVHFILSKDPDDNDGCYMVGEITLTKVRDGGRDILTTLHYPFKNREGDVFSYPSKDLFYWHLEGDICLEVICGKYRIFEVEESNKVL